MSKFRVLGKEWFTCLHGLVTAAALDSVVKLAGYCLSLGLYSKIISCLCLARYLERIRNYSGKILAKQKCLAFHARYFQTFFSGVVY